MSERIYGLAGSEDNAVAVFSNPEGIPATYHATWNEWKGYKSFVEVYGDQGMVRGSYAPMQNLLLISNGPNGAVKKTRRFYPEIMVREKLKSWISTATISFQEELDDFLKLADGNVDVPLADGYAGLRSLELAKAVRDSSSGAELVKLPSLGRMPSV